MRKEFIVLGQVFNYPVRVRAYECDSFGHVNNAVYIQYLQQATIEVLRVGAASALPQVHTLAIEYENPARFSDELDIAVSVIAANGARFDCSYEISRVPDKTPVAFARIEWSGPGAEHGLREITPAHAGHAALKPLVTPKDNGARPFRWRHTVSHYELDVLGQAQLAAYFNWLEEAFFQAVRVAGWPLSRLREENFLTLQYRHDAEFFAAAEDLDEIEVVSRLIDIRRVRGIWIHELYRVATNTLLMRDYSTERSWTGKASSAPHRRASWKNSCKASRRRIADNSA